MIKVRRETSWINPPVEGNVPVLLEADLAHTTEPKISFTSIADVCFICCRMRAQAYFRNA